MSLDDPTNEDRPPQLPNSYRKLNRLCVSQRTSSWNRKRKHQHGQGRECLGANLVFEVTVASQLIATIAGR